MMNNKCHLKWMDKIKELLFQLIIKRMKLKLMSEKYYKYVELNQKSWMQKRKKILKIFQKNGLKKSFLLNKILRKSINNK